MKSKVIFLAMIVGLCTACTSKEATPAAKEPKPGVELAATGSKPAAKETEGAIGKSLASYLKSTEQISLCRIETTESGRKRGEPATVSKPEKVRAFLDVIDLEQKIHGALARCMSDFELAFRDEAGAELGSIGICGGVPGKFPDPYQLAVRFNAPKKGEFGGIGVSDGKALMTLIHEQLAAAKPGADEKAGD
ncbi:MAG: hypothetical protein JXR96_22280 [Deltaproteobacteria bacterium]|nr:hypothetical protein [Deltaproteobacteria bacterium]